MNVELDVEKNLQARCAKDRIRIKEFFIDFDKLRKGVVGEAAVSILKQFVEFRGFLNCGAFWPGFIHKIPESLFSI